MYISDAWINDIGSGPVLDINQLTWAVQQESGDVRILNSSILSLVASK